MREQHNAHVHAWWFIGRMLYLYRLMLVPDLAVPACARALAKYREAEGR